MSAAKRIRGMRSKNDCDANALSLEESNQWTLPELLFEDEKSVKGPKIELKNVWFKYPTRDVPVLRGLNMTASSRSRAPGRVLTSHRSRQDNSPRLSGHRVRKFLKSDFSVRLTKNTGCGKTSIISLLER